MDGRGGCCIARYVGGAYDMSKVDRIMLRFRPIAPKPAASGSVSGDSTPEKPEVTSRNGKGKRKYVKDSGAKRCNRKKKASPEIRPAVTLPLLPESPECSPAKKKKEARNAPVWLSFDNGSDSVSNQVEFGSSFLAGVPPGAVLRPVRTVASYVTVECVTDTWVDGEALGCTDRERRRNLEGDTCPGFISDGVGKVTWTNGAYRMMVGQGEGCEMRVWLTMKERLPETAGGGEKFPAFTCRVKVQYTWGKEKSSLTVPCDVWRMDVGGYAWRLDVKAALSLGR